MNYFNYFSEIEETFVRRRGKNLLLSPLDWALIESWKERGVPLAVALRSIETVFDKAEIEPSRKNSIKSLMYCRDEVETQYNFWLNGKIGADTEPETTNTTEELPEQQKTVLEHLNNAVAKLRNPGINLNHNWQKISGEVLLKLNSAQKTFRQDNDAEVLEIVLNELDCRIDEALLESFPAAKINEIKQETAQLLRDYKNRMTGEAYEQTFRTILLKSLREQANLPRLSLYYLL